MKQKFKTRFFGILPKNVKGEVMYKLVTLEEGEKDSLEIVDEKGPYYMLELDMHLKIELGREKQRLFKGVIDVKKGA